MFNERLQSIGFFILLGTAAILSVFLFWPFMEIIAFAGIIAVLFRPWFLKMSKHFNSENIAAIITVLSAVLIVLVPLFIIAYVLYFEIVNVYTNVTNGSFNLDQGTIVSRFPQSIQNIANGFFTDLGSRISSIAGTTVKGVTGLFSNIVNFFLNLFLLFFSLFYFLRDGEKIKSFVGGIFPLSRAHETKLVDDLEMAISGVVKGSFLVALTQGSVATVGFLIFGVPQPFLWGAFTVLAALVPTFGTSISLIPAVLYLFLTGHTGAAIGLIIWGAVAVGLVDNFIGPRLVGSRANLHPLMVLFAVLGGIQFFGFLGFLLGPILLAVFMTLATMYQEQLKAKK
jgi:predicted PurR-regulated permease PerM